jgi:hypothetical protein
MALGLSPKIALPWMRDACCRKPTLRPAAGGNLTGAPRTNSPTHRSGRNRMTGHIFSAIRRRLALGLVIRPSRDCSPGQSLFEPSGSSFRDVPFPHELRCDADGPASVTGFPRIRSSTDTAMRLGGARGSKSRPSCSSSSTGRSTARPRDLGPPASPLSAAAGGRGVALTDTTPTVARQPVSFDPTPPLGGPLR